MPHSPTFTVLVPTYNQAEYLGAALDSLLAQTDADWEAVVVNDGSTDGTRNILESYCSRDDRFRVIHKENGGVATALNRGLQEAKGDWVCWLSSDDLFDKRKLEVHRQWIGKHPSCRFFFTRFCNLDHATGRIIRVPMWRSIPDPEWQVLELLRAGYIHGNSICISRESWLRAGPFDASLRHGQDYDMWLRLAALFPAVFVPEITCVTRLHPAQGARGFPELGFFESCKSAINFLNRHSFAELVPFVDLEDSSSARKAVTRSLDVAAHPTGFLYSLGPHPALLFRILEWCWTDDARRIDGTIRQLVQRWTVRISRQFQGSRFGLMWKAAAIACRQAQSGLPYHPVSATTVAEAHYWSLRASDSPRAKPFRRYLELIENRSLPESASASRGASREIVFVCPEPTGRVGDLESAERQTIAVSRYLARTGRNILLLGSSIEGVEYADGVLSIGADHVVRPSGASASLGLMDTVIGVSRTDVLSAARARRYLVKLDEVASADSKIPVEAINRVRVPVACISEFSRSSLVAAGVSADLVRVVPYACDLVGCGGTAHRRHPHSLIFVSQRGHDSGLDLALRAFSILTRRFPDATLHVYGRMRSWQQESEHLFNPDWLDVDGTPHWSTIEASVPGCRYCGIGSEDDIADAFRRQSILVVASRTTQEFCSVSVDAQSFGCIPVLPSRGGYPETVREGRTGYLYRENTPEALAACIQELWDGGLPRDAQRSEAQEWVQGRFSPEKTGEGLLEMLEAAPAKGVGLHAVLPYVQWRLAQLERVLHRIRRGAALLTLRFRDQPVMRWPSVLMGLWAEIEEGRWR